MKLNALQPQLVATVKAPAASSDAMKRQAQDTAAIIDPVTISDKAASYSTDPEVGGVVVKIVDTETKQVIRQIPPEAVLKYRRYMASYIDKLSKENIDKVV